MNRTRGMIARVRLFLPGNFTSSLGNSRSSQRGVSCSSARKSWWVFMANHSIFSSFFF